MTLANQYVSTAAHQYVSTACQHTLHDRCRQVCKFCGTRCLCPCHRDDDPGVVRARLEHIDMHLSLLRADLIRLREQGAHMNAETKAALARIETATTDLGTRVTALIAKIGTGMSDAEVLEVNSELGDIGARLEGMAKDPENPVGG
jgi:hypothetical protein